jgi:diguanylate cyclase (GGDEF)-like protein/PAS domain S-box-containing protein
MKTKNPGTECFAGNSKMHPIMCGFDWSAFYLGPPENWPASLRAMVIFMLDSKFPMCMALGPELRVIYNDAYIYMLEQKHPAALGARLSDVWTEIWPQLEPIMLQVMNGNSSFHQNIPMDIIRNSYRGRSWVTFSASPIRDDKDDVVGVMCICNETTKQILAEQRHVFQLELTDRLRELSDPGEIMEQASALLGQHLGLSRVGYVEVDNDGNTITINRNWTNGEVSPLSGEIKTLDEFGPLIGDAVRAGKILAIDDINEDERCAPYANAYAALDIRAFMAIPLMKAGRLRAVLHLHHTHVRTWADYDMRLAEDVVERTWAAVENARAQTELRVERDRSQYIFDTMTEGFGVINRDWTIQQINSEGLRLGQRSASEVIGRNHWEVWPESVGTEVDRMYHQVMESRIADRIEYCQVFSNGLPVWIENSAYPSLDGGLAVFFRDITERKRNEKKLRDAAQHDTLTGLPNRALLDEYCLHILAMSARFGERGAVLFIDLNRFKPINDLYGHHVGDEALQEIARRLQACTRKEDLVSRLGGDEFVVVLPRIESSQDTIAVAQHILAAMEMPIISGALRLGVSASIGISLFPEHGNELEPLIRCADLAMYSAKKMGRNNYKLYSPGLNEHANGLLLLEMQLKHALESNRLMLFYQPIIDIHTREMIGAEALIRMPAKNGTILNPTDFIPVAEATGLINRLGEWVVREACRQHQEWLSRGLPQISIAVNVSAIQFRQAAFSSLVENAIHESGIDPACLQIEVTESTVMENIAETVEKLNHLQSMGVRISLDDFGTGYSSLSYLSTLPLDKLKIDQSFVRMMMSSQTCRSITEAIIGLGRTLNLKVVGEGIESEESMEYLRGYGCDQAQGFLFSKPLPANEFESWSRKHFSELH